MRNLSKGVWLNVGSVAIMAISPLLNKFALGSISAPLAALIASAWALAFAAALCLVRKQRITVGRQDGPLLVSGLASAVGTILLFESLARVSPVLIGLIGRFYIVMTVLLAYFILKERPTRTDWLCGAVAVLGAVIFVPKGGSGTTFGVCLALAYTLFFALANTLAKTNLARCSPESQLYITTLVTVITLAGYVGARGAYVGVDTGAVGLLAVSAFCGSFAGLWLFFRGLQYIDFYSANVIRTTSPLWVALFAWPFFPVPITLEFVAGGALMVASLLALGLFKARDAHKVTAKPLPTSPPVPAASSTR